MPVWPGWQLSPTSCPRLRVGKGDRKLRIAALQARLPHAQPHCICCLHNTSTFYSRAQLSSNQSIHVHTRHALRRNTVTNGCKVGTTCLGLQLAFPALLLSCQVCVFQGHLHKGLMALATSMELSPRLSIQYRS